MISSSKERERENFQFTQILTEDHLLQGYSTTIWNGATRILQEVKAFQIAIFFSESTESKVIKAQCGMKLERVNKQETLAVTLI